MSTSQFQGVILYDPGDLDTDEPLDTVLVRDEIIDSALHKADEAGQVRCSWVAINPTIAPVSSLAPLHLPYDDDTMTAAGADRWWDFAWRGGFDAKIKADRSGYRLPIMIAGASDTGVGGGMDFAVVVGPAPLTVFDVDIDAPSSRVAVATVTGVTSTSPAWLTLDSGLTYIDVPATLIEAARASTPPEATLTDIGGDPTTVQTARLEIMVCGRFKTTGEKPVFYGLRVAEYIG